MQTTEHLSVTLGNPRQDLWDVQITSAVHLKMLDVGLKSKCMVKIVSQILVIHNMNDRFTKP